MKRCHHVSRYREAIWKHRHRYWFIVCADDDGYPVAIANAAEQAMVRLIYREYMRRQRIGAA